MTEEAKKALHYGRPFITQKDFDNVREGNYAAAGQSIKNRGWIILLVAVVVGLIFLTNAMSSFLLWVDIQDSRSLTSFVLWALVSVVILIYGLRYFKRLSKSGKWFLRKSTGTVES